MKYINCLCEGSLLKYSLDEPLVAGNVNVYYLRLNTSNFNRAYNSVWNAAMKIQGMLKRVSFENSGVGSASIETLIEQTDDDGLTYFECAVPAKQLQCTGRLSIGIEFYLPGEQDGDAEFIYHTATSSCPPKVYPSVDFSQTIKVSEDSTLQSLINNLSGGRTNQILTKNSELLTDFEWVYSVPGALIYGGLGNFPDEGKLEISLSSYAQELLINNNIIEYPANTVEIDGMAPEKYSGLQFIILEEGELVTREKTLSLKLGEQLISDGTFWGVIPQVKTTIEDLNLQRFTSKFGENPKLYGYHIQLGQQNAYINLASFGTSEQFTTSTDPTQGLINIRNIINFSGKLKDFLQNDTLLEWSKIGSSTFLVDEKMEGFYFPSSKGIVEVVVLQQNLLLRWYNLTNGLNYYRLGNINSGWTTDWIQSGSELISQENIDDLSNKIDDPTIYAETIDF